jgi:hypothetical protein
MTNLADTRSCVYPSSTVPSYACNRSRQLLRECPRIALERSKAHVVSQLRIYKIREGLMDEWRELFFGTLMDIHRMVGINVTAAWQNTADPLEFVWIREFRSAESVEEQENEFFSTPERRALGDVRGKFVESLQVRGCWSRTTSPGTPAVDRAAGRRCGTGRGLNRPDSSDRMDGWSCGPVPVGERPHRAVVLVGSEATLEPDKHDRGVLAGRVNEPRRSPAVLRDRRSVGRAPDRHRCRSMVEGSS